MLEQELINHMNKSLSYDPETGEFTYKVARGPRKAGDVAGTICNHYGYRIIGVGPKGSHRTYGAHRLAFLLMEGRWPGIIDHKNGVRDDNRWENLRECTQQQNCMNTSSRRGTSSKYRGVRKRNRWVSSLNENRVVWLAQIYVNKKNKHLGYFDTEDAAAEAYNEAARMYFGEYAKINEIL